MNLYRNAILQWQFQQFVIAGCLLKGELQNHHSHTSFSFNQTEKEGNKKKKNRRGRERWWGFLGGEKDRGNRGRRRNWEETFLRGGEKNHKIYFELFKATVSFGRH